MSGGSGHEDMDMSGGSGHEDMNTNSESEHEGGHHLWTESNGYWAIWCWNL
ncbi:hypothetical protein V7152_04025 [Neobacillus drentensis]|uniref:hypothetical protein n=1 Tax=Neobacillus drentensis TaxID=220684 RepID=UPI002FFE4D24